MTSPIPKPLACLTLALLAGLATSASAAEAVLHIQSDCQPGTNDVRVLLPSRLAEGKTCPVVYVLPVEAGDGTRWGDSFQEVLKQDLHNKHQVICVFPQFAQLPWYADHPTDPDIRQESYLLESVLPLIERTYPVAAGRSGRLLVGFSKSGFGAWSLLLRHPDLFEKAAAFDAPLMQRQPNKYGMSDIFGTQENFAHYDLVPLLQKNAASLTGPPRLILIGAGNFDREHDGMHALLDRLRIPHVFIAGPRRAHAWESGWLPEAFQAVAGSLSK